MEGALLRNLSDVSGNNLVHVMACLGHVTSLAWLLSSLPAMAEALHDENKFGQTPTLCAVKVRWRSPKKKKNGGVAKKKKMKESLKKKKKRWRSPSKKKRWRSPSKKKWRSPSKKKKKMEESLKKKDGGVPQKKKDGGVPQKKKKRKKKMEE